MMKRTIAAVVVGVAILGTAGARGQAGPGVEGATTGTQPAATQEGGGRKLEVVRPEVDQAAKAVRLPAAFWNEHLTDWVEVAVCGRPSDFLHETIVSVTTTKALMVEALRAAEFVDADAWVSSVADFPRIRGDKAMLLLEVERNGKKEIYPLDELLTYQGWGVSIGPFGWMFKGEPERAGAKGGGVAGLKAHPATTEPGEEEAGLSAGQRILRDDPQVALQFRGIQHMSQSYMDHPLCYDDWMYATIRYHRNRALLPPEVYDSNGSVPVRLTMQKVTEGEFLRAMAKYWHEADYAKYMLAQLPIAEQIDKDKVALWQALPALRKRIADAQTMDGAVRPAEWEEFGKVAVLAAAIEKGYTALDAAWTEWACGHVKLEGYEEHDRRELEKQRDLWREHMEAKRTRAEQLWKAEVAGARMRELKKAAATPETQAGLRQANGQEIAARARAMLAENQQPREYWKYEQSRITPGDPRKDWIRSLKWQVELAEAKVAAGEAGVAFGEALAGGQEDKGKQGAYQRAVLRAALAGLQVQLCDVEFEVSKREGMTDDPDLQALIKKRDQLREQIKVTEAATQAGK